MRQRRRRSAAITLVLAGTITGCGGPEPQRDVYRTLAECQRDWAAAQQCQPARDDHYSNAYYGPQYYASAFPDGSPRPNRNAMATVRVSRGGFGSSSHSFSSGG
jgi:uncharacterized protein YgiB involved in biofilm formation